MPPLDLDDSGKRLTPPSTAVEKHHDTVKAAFPGTPPPLPTTFPSAMAR